MKNAQHSVHPTGGTLRRRVFEPFAWLEAGSDKMALSHPAHQRVPRRGMRDRPHTVGRLLDNRIAKRTKTKKPPSVFVDDKLHFEEHLNCDVSE